MPILQTIELQAQNRPFSDLSKQLLKGEFFIIRNCLQEIGLFDKLEQASISGIRNSIGQQTADQVKQVGLEKIHTIVNPDQIPVITDAVYEIIAPLSFEFIKTFVREILGETKKFYFERNPNVRFHIPYDLAASHMKNYRQFAKHRGDGKITPHNPHRDSWVDCADNLINVWIAVGPVKTGNGLTIYPDSYHSDIKHTGPYISADQRPGLATTFDMSPGDVLLFHGDHLHGSEINITDETRHVISFRVTLEKPHYPYGHYHHYAYSGLAGGPLDFLAEVPQNMAWSYINYRIKLVIRKLRELIVPPKTDTPSVILQENPHDQSTTSTLSLPLSELETGHIRALSQKACIARLESGEIIAFSRYCPHQGADLSLGVIQNGEIKCPWHNLGINPKTGASACQSLKKLKEFPCEVQNNYVYVNLN